MNQTKEDTKEMMAMLLNLAKQTRERYKYSGDEEMMPMAYIFGEAVTIMMMTWKDNKEKYLMAAAANMKAREQKARSLSFVTDARWVNSDSYVKYYKLPEPKEMGVEKFTAHYHRTLAAHGGELKTCRASSGRKPLWCLPTAQASRSLSRWPHTRKDRMTRLNGCRLILNGTARTTRANPTC